MTPVGSGPRLTMALSTSRLSLVTMTGTVSSRAANVGTPTWLIDSHGSGETTVRAEKFTRFPDRLERKRPSLPFSLCTRVFSGRPLRCLAGGMPEVWLS
ncbi:MAG: hypothetical protein A4E30_01613 [Methanomassiliicoccales archaeon PtaB.Bin215]|nr:MAG: hypothetical protein A4E30_01613 [Methanomassiliicoccales archaeon PtaB.Bin215]